MGPRAWPLLAASVLLIARVVRAGEATDEESARRDYDRGARAYERGDLREAASAFADADARVPSPTALRAAIDAAVEADLAVLGETLLERAATRQPEPQLDASVRAARARFAGRTGRLRVDCPSACLATVDGAIATVGAPIVLLVGAHELKVDAEGSVLARRVEIAPDRSTQVSLARPRAPGAPPLLFAFGAGLTVAAGALTGVFLADTIEQHDRFLAQGCLHTPACSKAAADGVAAQTRTNVALAATVGLAAVTATVGVFFTRWTRAPLTLSVSASSLSLRVAFR